jgi:hypothetical protein
VLDLVSSRLALERLFAHRPVADLSELAGALDTSSRMSVFRRLSALGYLSSYSHTGRFYTLRSIPQFDADGLWRFEGVGFSRDGTLKATVLRLVVESDSGRTQRELQLRLGVRVHNPLLELVERSKLRRDSIGAEYVYLATNRARAAEQLERRRLVPAATVSSTVEIEVLLEVIHGTRPPPQDAKVLTARLLARGVRVGVAEVAAVLERHGLEKKHRRRPSRPLPR